MARLIRQLEVAGQELAPFIEKAHPITPLGSEGKWHMRLIRLPEAEGPIAEIIKAVRSAKDPEAIPIRINFEDILGTIDIDTSVYGQFVVVVEKKTPQGVG